MKATNGGGNGTSLLHRSLPELEALKAQVDAAITEKREAKKRVTQQLIDMAQREGFDAKELLAVKARPDRAAKASVKTGKPAKYRDPSDHKRTWSGYGKTPGWMAGKPKEAFAIR